MCKSDFYQVLLSYRYNECKIQRFRLFQEILSIQSTHSEENTRETMRRFLHFESELTDIHVHRQDVRNENGGFVLRGSSVLPNQGVAQYCTEDALRLQHEEVGPLQLLCEEIKLMWCRYNGTH